MFLRVNIDKYTYENNQQFQYYKSLNILENQKRFITITVDIMNNIIIPFQL